MTTNDMADWEVVEKAADIAEERGVCVGSGRASSQVCIDVALVMAMGLSEAQAKDAYLEILLPHSEVDPDFKVDVDQARRIVARMAQTLSLEVEETRGGRPAAAALYHWNDNCTMATAAAEEVDLAIAESAAEARKHYKFTNVLDGARYAAKVMRLEDEGIT